MLHIIHDFYKDWCILWVWLLCNILMFGVFGLMFRVTADLDNVKHYVHDLDCTTVAVAGSAGYKNDLDFNLD